jgi:AcrR family transcriptional regulator
MMPDEKEASTTDARDEEILRAAFTEFTEKGFHGATMLAVASRARASKATLYARFGNKEGLFQALLAWGCRQVMVDLQAIVASAEHDPRKALEDCAVRLLRGMGSPYALALLRVAVAEGTRQPEVGRIYNSLTRDPIVALLRQVVGRLIAAGFISGDDPQEFGAAFIGMLRGDLFYQALLGVVPPPEPEELEKIARKVVARLLRAFAP